MSASSIEEFAGTNVICVYPNPTTGNFNIELSKNFTNVKVNITNVLGQLVYENNFKSAATIPVEMPNKSKGIYIVQVFSENDIIASFKISKQ